jgi:two-component system sensor histidine kinase GlrK
LRHVADRRELHSQARQLRVTTEAPEESAKLDAEKIAVVLDNLLSNAIDFSPEGGEIRLLASHREHLWRFECIDQGEGISGDDASRIFDPFFQGARPAPVERQGSGVGLSIVRELVRAMNGRVSLLPSNVGAHFCVEIPDGADSDEIL